MSVCVCVGGRLSSGLCFVIMCVGVSVSACVCVCFRHTFSGRQTMISYVHACMYMFLIFSIACVIFFFFSCRGRSIILYLDFDHGRKESAVLADVVDLIDCIVKAAVLKVLFTAVVFVSIVVMLDTEDGVHGWLI